MRVPLPVPTGTKLPSNAQSGMSARPRITLRCFMTHAVFLHKRGHMLICFSLYHDRRRKNRNIACHRKMHSISEAADEPSYGENHSKPRLRCPHYPLEK